MKDKLGEWSLVLLVAAGAGSFLFLFFQVRSQNAATHRQAAAGRQALAALCVLKGDLEQRVQQSRDFLKTHPHGIPGITAATIRVGIVNQERTIGSLANLNCPTKETP